jgi:hypothetical protein
MSDFTTTMSDERFAEIRERLNEPPPVVSVARNHSKSPVASYLSRLRNDQMDLVEEIIRLKAELEAARVLPVALST